MPLYAGHIIDAQDYCYERINLMLSLLDKAHAQKFQQMLIGLHCSVPGSCNITEKIKQLHNTTLCSKSPTLPPEVEEEEQDCMDFWPLKPQRGALICGAESLPIRTIRFYCSDQGFCSDSNLPAPCRRRAHEESIYRINHTTPQYF